MTRLPRSLALVLLATSALLALTPRTGRAQWVPGGVQKGTDGGAIVGYGTSGFILADIVAYNLSQAGVPQWTSGIMFCNFGSCRYSDLTRTTDGLAGVITASGSTGGDIYANRVNSSGTILWGAFGVVVCNATGTQSNPVPCSDGSGGAIVAWADLRGADSDIYAQRVGSSGTVQWTANGVAICALSGAQQSVAVTPDGGGGAFLVWTDARAGAVGGQDIYAQHVNGSGAPQWAANGIAVCNAAGVQESPIMISDGTGGAIIAWVDLRGADRDVYAQRLDGSGSALWTANGVQVVGAAGDQLLPVMVTDGGQGTILGWEDHRVGGSLGVDIYAQRLNGSGAPQWTAGGVAVCVEPHAQSQPKITAVESGGAIILWADQRPVNAVHAYVQRLDASGAALWTPDGAFVDSGVCSFAPPFYSCASDGQGGAYVDLPTNCTGTMRLYRVLPDGTQAWIQNYTPAWTGVLDEPLDQGGWVRLQLNRPLADGGGLSPAVVAYNVWRRVPGTALAAQGASASAIAPEAAARAVNETNRLDAATAAAAGFPPGTWESLGYHLSIQAPTLIFGEPTHDDSSAAGPADDAFVVTSHTASGLYVVSPPASGHSVDNLPPAEPTNLAGSASAPNTVELHWTGGGESDLLTYEVYKGASADFVPAPGNRVATPTSPTWTDGAFAQSYYKVSAMDVHGNQSGFAALAPGQVTGVGNVPARSYLARPAPNPAQSSALLAYGLARSGQAFLGIYDARGRLIRTITRGETPAGTYREAWNGTDEHGRHVAPGVYLVKLTSPGIEQTERLVWLE